MQPRALAVTISVTCCVVLGIAACGSQQPGPQRSSAEKPSGTVAPMLAETPLPAESNPPGDIPDTQAFVSYTSQPGRFRVDVPEGWARATSGEAVSFVDKFDGERIAWSPTACSARDRRDALAAQIKSAGGAPSAIRVTSAILPTGRVLLATYEANSAPEPVTGKRVRLGENAYLITSGGRCALVTLWAPAGADNVDQWQRIARSFQWL